MFFFFAALIGGPVWYFGTHQSTALTSAELGNEAELKDTRETFTQPEKPTAAQMTSDSSSETRKYSALEIIEARTCTSLLAAVHAVHVGNSCHVTVTLAPNAYQDSYLFSETKHKYERTAFTITYMLAAATTAELRVDVSNPRSPLYISTRTPLPITCSPGYYTATTVSTSIDHHYWGGCLIGTPKQEA